VLGWVLRNSPNLDGGGGGGLPAAAPTGEAVDAEESAVLPASAGSGWR
jgi:hypothetical protein